MAYVIPKHHMGSTANTRICSGPHDLIVITEIRCEVMKKVPRMNGTQRGYIRCTNGICPTHDSSLTVMDEKYDHVCPQCFVQEVSKLMG